MGIRIKIPPRATPVDAVLALMASFGRKNIEMAIELMIERLDTGDGDPDLEDGDEDRCAAQDDHVGESWSILGNDWYGGDADDEETTFPEWASLPFADRRAGRFQGRPLISDLYRLGIVDDAELDEPDVCSVNEDNAANFSRGHRLGFDSTISDPDAESGDGAEDAFDPFAPMGPGCPLSDPGGTERDPND